MQRQTPSKDFPEERKLRSLQEEELQPIYVLFGRERYFIRRALSTLRARIIPTPDMDPFLYHALQGSEVDEDRLVDLAQTPPFFEQKQLILVREAERIRNPGHASLVRYAKDPASFSSLVLVAGDTFPKGDFFKTVRERFSAGCLEFARLRRSDLFRWISRIAGEKELRHSLDRPFLEELVSAVGADLETLENQIEKLALFSQGQEGNGLEDPLPIPGSPAAVEEGYRLTDALLAARWDQSVQLLQQFLDQGLHPLVLLSRISREVRKLWQIKRGLEQSDPIEDLCRASGIPSFKKDAYIAAARRCTWEAMRRIFFTLEEVDRSLKSSRLSSQLHLEELCAEIILALGHGAGPRKDGSGRAGR